MKRSRHVFFLSVALCVLFVFANCAYAGPKLKKAAIPFNLYIVNQGSVIDESSSDHFGIGAAQYEHDSSGELLRLWTHATALGGGETIGKAVGGWGKSSIKGIHYKDFIVDADLPEGSSISFDLFVESECHGYVNATYFGTGYSNYGLNFSTGFLIGESTAWNSPILGQVLFSKSTDPVSFKTWVRDAGTDLIVDLQEEAMLHGLKAGLAIAGVAASAIPVAGVVAEVGMKVVEFGLNLNNYVADKEKLEFYISGNNIVRYDNFWYKVSSGNNKHIYRVYVVLDLFTAAQKLQLQDFGTSEIYADFYNHQPHYGDDNGNWIPRRGFRVVGVTPTCTQTEKISMSTKYDYPQIMPTNLRRLNSSDKAVLLGQLEKLQLTIRNKGRKLMPRACRVHVATPDPTQSFDFTLEPFYGTEKTYSFDYKFQQFGENVFTVTIDADGILDPYLDLTRSEVFKFKIEALSDLKAKIISFPGEVEVNKETEIPVRVSNIGKTVSGPTRVVFTANNIFIHEADIPALKENEFKDITFKWTPKKTGKAHLLCLVNPDKIIEEYNYEDNQAYKEVEVVKGKNIWSIVPGSLAFEPSHPQVGETAKISFIVKNSGRAEGSIAYRVLVDEEKIIQSTVRMLADSVIGVGTGGADNILWKVTGGDHAIKVILDPDNNLPDIDRSKATSQLGFSAELPVPAVAGKDLLIRNSDIRLEDNKLKARIYNCGKEPAEADIFVYQYSQQHEGAAFAGKYHRKFSGQGCEFLVLDLPQYDTKYEIVLDKENKVTEANEENNTASLAMPGYIPYKPKADPEANRKKGPDLIVANIITSDQPLVPQEPRAFEVSIANQNLVDAAAVDVEYEFYNYDTKDNLTLHGYLKGKKTLNLKAEGQETIRIDYTPVYAGNFELRIMVDPGNKVQETNKTNNRMDKTFVVGGEVTPGMYFAGKDVDLVIDKDNPQVSNREPQVGEAVSFKVRVTNNSPIKIWGADLDMFINDKLEEGYPLWDMEAFTSKEIIFSHTFNVAGDYTVKIIADAKKALPEKNEDNNTITLPIKVKPGILGTGHRDVALTSFGLSKNQCLQGELVTVSAGVKNIGQDTLRLVLFTISVGQERSKPFFIKVIPILKAQEEQKFSTTLLAPVSGEYTVVAQIDGKDIIKEENEDNNILKTTIKVEPISTDKAKQKAAEVVTEKANKILETVDNWLKVLGKPKQ